MFGGWGSWNIIGWIALAMLAIFVVMFVFFFVAEACSMARKKLNRYRCRHGWHAPGPSDIVQTSWDDHETMTRKIGRQSITHCKHCDVILSRRTL